MKPIILFAFANDRNDYSKNLRNLPKELDTIENVLKTAEKQDLCEIEILYNTNFKKLLDLTQDSRYRDHLAMLHFGGHGDKDLLVLENEEGGQDFIEADALVGLLSMRKNLQFVFLNACNTQEIALKFATKGISAVGTKGKIYDDEMLLALVYRFYHAIGEQMTIQGAWQETELAIKAQYKTDLETKYKGEFYWEMQANPTANNWKLGNNLTDLRQNKPSTGMDLESFKKELLEQLDENGYAAVPEVLAKIKNSGFEYNKPTFANLNQQGSSKLTSLDPDPFIGQLKVFIGTLKVKK